MELPGLSPTVDRLILVCCFIMLSHGFPVAITSSRLKGNDTDLLSLLAVKANVLEDPLDALSSWNESTHFCQWQGITCGRRHQRVIVLNLQSQKLVGYISPHIGNLSFLRELRLNNNNFSRGIPPEIGQLPRLQILRLNENSISGHIPANISFCLNLIHLNLAYNKVSGEVPIEFGSLSKLIDVSIHVNNIKGSILPLGNLSSLRTLIAGENDFDGSIPCEFGRMANLQSLILNDNRFSGSIPLSLFNLSSLVGLDVSSNQLRGSLPWYVGIALPNIEFFSIAINQFTGFIPVTISNSSNLRFLQLNDNYLVGMVPSLERLHNLKQLHIGFNQLGSGEGSDLRFLSSLINATNLKVLHLDQNNFGGMLPESIGNLSTKLQSLSVQHNQIFGSIPPVLENLVGLEALAFSNNKLTGNIPANIGKLRNLHEAYLSMNKLSGKIPPTFGNLSLLNILSLASNTLLGDLPASLGECNNLQVLQLAENNLSGTIPKQVIGLSSLSIYVDLSQNQLSGLLPLEVGKLINLGYLDLFGNLLSGAIPVTLGGCVRLETLRMGNNFFQGPIPSSLSSLRGIQELDFSNNNLSGAIPEFLEGFIFLQRLNLSFNNFQGIVPTKGIFANVSAISLKGNNKLCGGIVELQLPHCSFQGNGKGRSKKTVILATSLSFGFLGLSLVVCLLYHFLFRKERRKSCSNLLEPSLWKVSYRSLFEATDGFSTSNLIGAGAFGFVYKGFLDGRTIAVKVFNILHQAASKSFISECMALRNIKHRNLVKVLTACSGVDYQGNDFKALVYEFMMNGTLEEWLHPNADDLSSEVPRKLNLHTRLNIIIDVACALDYLHNHCQSPIVHCDLKPSNILLDEEMIGHVGDFGLSKLLIEPSPNASTNDTSSMGLRGSIGYIAPEYGMGSKVSTYGDIYSFGIILLEMFTSKQPTDEIFNGSVSLHSFVKEAIPSRIFDIVDPVLLAEEREATGQRIMEWLILILEVGVVCCSALPTDRMPINHVVGKLQSIRNTMVGPNIETE